MQRRITIFVTYCQICITFSNKFGYFNLMIKYSVVQGCPTVVVNDIRITFGQYQQTYTFRVVSCYSEMKCRLTSGFLKI